MTINPKDIMPRRGICGIMFAITLSLCIFMQGCGMKSPELKIYALKYGESLFPQQYVFHGAAAGKTMNFCWLFYYIEYGDKKILVDTGFNNEKYIRLFSIKKYVRPAELLKRNSISPEDITDIIITHAHFDHIDGIDSFPGAGIIISQTELDLVKQGRYGVSMREKLAQFKNITSFSDEYMLYEIFKIKKTGGHTPGSSVVYIDRSASKFCLTGDEVYTKENLERGVMNGTVTSAANNMSFIRNYDKNYTPLTFHNPEYYGSSDTFIRIY